MLRTLLLACFVLVAALVARRSAADDYVVVVSKKTQASYGWSEVVDELKRKHAAEALVYNESPNELLEELARRHPRYTCFVTQPTEATKELVATVHQLTRQYDDDPYTDTRWGILTGYNASGAYTIAAHRKPLTVRKVASGTEVALEMCEEGVCFDELEKNKIMRKTKNSEAQLEEGPDDTTAALVDTLNDYQPDLFVTSGHATERDWQIGFRYRNGKFTSSAGQLVGRDTAGQVHEIGSNNPKVYLPIGNCLMGHIDGADAMALAWMNDAGVQQMIGYTVPTWFGYAGWGCLDYFVEQPGRYTFAEAFLANHHALIHKLETTEEDRRGLEFDRDVLAFYGDPKWEAKMADSSCAYDQELTEHNGIYTLRITPQRGADSFHPINTNGSQRGWRPIVAFLPHRVHNVQIVMIPAGIEVIPVVTDDFVLVPNPRQCDSNRPMEVVFKADRME
ncbi:MAG: hypothetical protein ACR2NU_13695 [Aeoliella sp.]